MTGGVRRAVPGLVVVAAFLAGCASRPAPAPRGAVGMREVDAAVAPAARLVLRSNESFQRPLFAAGNALPEYPQALLSQRLPAQAVCLRVGISETGHVLQSTPVQEGPDCAATATAASGFIAAAQAAAQQWRFDPAFRCVFPEGEPPEHGVCVGEGVREVPQAVSLVYRFVFEQSGGRGTVRMAE